MKTTDSSTTNSKSLNILIYGGSFSPPTIAHQFIIESVSSLNCFDQIWVMPCRDRVDKKPSSSEKDRLKMIEIMIAKCFNRSKVCSSCFEYSIPWLNIKVPMVSSTMVRREVAKNRFSDKVIP